MLGRRFIRAGPWHRRAGLAMVEYGILLALLVVAAIGTFRGLFGTAHEHVVAYGDSVESASLTRPR